jgi:hypothetical protein
MTKENPLRIESNSSASRQITSEGRAASALSTVVVFDKEKRVVATTVAGVFGLAEGELTTSPADFWPIKE